MLETETAHFHMADVGRKRITARRAVAVGEFDPGSAFDAVVGRRLPKGDALAIAEIAGLQGAKNASQLLPMCHPLALDHVAVSCEAVAARRVIRVYCEAAAQARTGVEMEALAGVNAALLTLYDLTKPVEPALAIGGVRLLFKEGGKKGLWLHPDGLGDDERARFAPRAPARLDGVAAAVISVSDRASRGAREDLSGPRLAARLQALGAACGAVTLLADDPAPLAERIAELARTGHRLIVVSGGTGLGPRDLAPEALARVADRRVPGIGEVFRAESAQLAPFAWLSRAEAALVGGALVILLPGSPRAVDQGVDILAPLLAHALAMAAGEDHR